MSVINLDDIVDLQHLTLASSHFWRHLAHDKQTLAIADRMLTAGATHPQVAFSIYAAAHLRHQTPLLGTYIRTHGLNFLQPTWLPPKKAFEGNPILESLPEDMTPVQVRSLLTTSSAIYATTLRCITLYADRFESLQPLIVTGPVPFDMYTDALTDLPTGPRHSMPSMGSVNWGEVQRLLEAFWMVHFARLCFALLQQKQLDWPKDRLAKGSKMRPMDLFDFEKHMAWVWNSRKRPQDYLFTAYHIYLSAEEYLAECKVAPQSSSNRDLLPCQRILGAYQMWPQISDTMCHLVRLFKEIRSVRDGDGFYPWRRLGFAVWDEKRLIDAGLLKYPAYIGDLRGRDLDRIRWLSIIREEDFSLVQTHRLTVHDSDKEAADDPDYTYPEDTDHSWSQ